MGLQAGMLWRIFKYRDPRHSQSSSPSFPDRKAGAETRSRQWGFVRHYFSMILGEECNGGGGGGGGGSSIV